MEPRTKTTKPKLTVTKVIDTQTSNDRTETASKPLWLRLLPLAVLICGTVAFFAMGWHKYISFEQLRQHHEALGAWIKAQGIWAPVLFGLAYAVMTAFSIPGGAVATIVGGFFFGLITGSIAVVVGATLGATVVFLAARSALGGFLRRKSQGWLKRMESGFREDAFSYLLVLRLIPLFPFWLVNLVPAFLGVPLRTFVIATFIGIIPGSIVYVSLGNGIGALLKTGGTPDFGIIFKPEILLPLIGMAVLALLPVFYKRYQRSRGKTPAGNPAGNAASNPADTSVHDAASTAAKDGE